MLAQVLTLIDFALHVHEKWAKPPSSVPLDDVLFRYSSFSYLKFSVTFISPGFQVRHVQN